MTLLLLLITFVYSQRTPARKFEKLLTVEKTFKNFLLEFSLPLELKLDKIIRQVKRDEDGNIQV